MSANNVVAKLEAMLFAAGDAVEIEKLAGVLEQDVSDVAQMLEHLSAQYEEHNSGLCLLKLDNKYQLSTRTEYHPEIRELLSVRRNTPLSQAAFEVLAVVAYNQPVTRAFVEQVRGVDCSGAMAGLVQKGLIEERGRLDLPGRPLVYGTTDQFLRCFSLASLEDLPALPEDLNASGDQIEGQTSLETEKDPEVSLPGDALAPEAGADE